MRSTTRLATLVVGALLAASCSGGGTTTTGAPNLDTNPPNALRAARVSTENFSFQPSSIEVASQQEVVWTNNDSVAHTVTFDDGSTDVTLQPGESTSKVMSAAGEHAYHCTIHPSMKGTVTVTE